MVSDKAETWGAWLRARLDERGWSQSDLVREGKLSRANVSRWYRGIDTPNHRNTVIIANTLGVDHDDALDAAGFAAFSLPAPSFRLRDYSSEQLLDELLRRERETSPQTKGAKVVSLSERAAAPHRADINADVWDEPAAALDHDREYIEREQEETEREP